MHEDAEHVSGPNQAAIKQGKAWQCHEQDQRGCDYDPGCIGSVHGPFSSFASGVSVYKNTLQTGAS
jgi:hypothetical protein